MKHRTLTLSLALAALAACGGRSDDAVVDSAASVAPSVGAIDSASDSAYVDAQRRLDSLRAAGVSPADGIDSAAARAGGVLANDSTRDTLYYPGGRKP
ncbi:hypothetical protein [Roseisolibacter sp. H3M3-2]|uniref:hypothetical protein n=1 Tax=Roseisolibacter sp. H3M3-2 TaxID=3031323 RepID=UPI0023DC9C60|nr:hypothetical protein [Roseisolibacter sp. H3M3-2]MDF1504741.1 hypothetical protein [Roseisolibacter sp. H3M3-2]